MRDPQAHAKHIYLRHERLRRQMSANPPSTQRMRWLVSRTRLALHRHQEDTGWLYVRAPISGRRVWRHYQEIIPDEETEQ